MPPCGTDQNRLAGMPAFRALVCLVVVAATARSARGAEPEPGQARHVVLVVSDDQHWEIGRAHV